MRVAHVVSFCCVAALAVVGCSGGGGKRAGTTTSAPTTVAHAAGTDAGFGRCPSPYPEGTWRFLNWGVRGTKTKLVPIRATHVRICRYGGPARRLEGIGAGLTHSLAVRFEDETNRLSTVRGDATCDLLAGAPIFVVTFSAGTQQITVIDQTCIGADNGAIVARPTAHWLGEVEFYSSTDPGGR